MGKVTFFKDGKRLVVSETSARLAPPETEGWVREKGTAKVPDITKQFMGKQEETPVKPKVDPDLPFLGTTETPVEDTKETPVVEKEETPVKPKRVRNKAKK